MGLRINNFGLGTTIIKGITYPFQSDIKIVIKNFDTNKHEEYNIKNNTFNWQQSVKSLEEDDEVTITANADGWIGTSFTVSVY